MLDETLKQLIEFVKSTTPHVWEIAMKQVMVNNISYAIIWAILWAFWILFWFTYKPLRKAYDDASADAVMLPFFALGLVAVYHFVLVVAFLFSITSLVTGWVNPELAAIKLLLDMVKGN